MQCAFALIDIINAVPFKTYTYGLGSIKSAALLIFMSGEKGYRHLFPNTTILSHQWSSEYGGTEYDFKSYIKDSAKATQRMISTYEKATGFSKQFIRKKLLSNKDLYLVPEQALEFKLADKIITTIE